MDKDKVKDAARGSWPSILEHVGIPSDHLQRAHGPCPKCGGKDRFRMLDDWVQTGSSICNQCNSEGSGDGFSTIMWWKGCDFKEAVQIVADFLGIKSTKQKSEPKPKKTPEEQLEFFEQWNVNLLAMFLEHNPGIDHGGLSLAGARMAKYQTFTVMAFPIFGQDMMTVVGYVVMNTTSPHLTKWDKSGEVAEKIRHKTVAGSKSGIVGAHAVQKLRDVPHHAKMLIKTEGLTDALALMSCPHDPEDILICTNSSGTSETPKWMAEVMAVVDLVAVIHDADLPGQKGAKRWSDHIAAANPEIDVRNVQLPYKIEETKGKDLRDYLEGNIDDVKALIQDTPRIDASKVKIDPFEDYQAILDELNIDVIGELDSGEVMIYSKETRKTSTLKIRGLQQNELIQYCGKPAHEKIGEDGLSMKQVGRALAMIASYRRIHSDHKPRGIGIYKSDDDHLVLANGRHLSVFNDSLTKIESPRCEDLIFEFGSRDWFDHDQVDANLKKAKDQAWCRESIALCSEMIGRWTWDLQDIAPPIITGLIMATMVQDIWPWRPCVSIRGSSGAGKTFFAKFLFGDRATLSGVFGRLAHYMAQSTAAGLRQSVGRSSVAICIDEWDSTNRRHREEILGLLRTSGSGETQFYGSATQKSHEFGLKHVCWLQGIHVGLDHQADANRFLTFDLITPNDERYKAWRMPTVAEREDVFGRLLAIAVTYGLQAAQMSVELQREWSNREELDRRLVNNLAVPVAMLAAPGGDVPGVMFQLCQAVIVEDSSDIEAEEVRLVKEIMQLPVRGPAGTEYPAYSVLFGNSQGARELDPQCLSQLGIEAVDIQGETYVAVNSEKLVKKVDMETKSITQILKRLPGAFRKRRRSEIGNLWFVMIPRGTIEGGRNEPGTQEDSF